MSAYAVINAGLVANVVEAEDAQIVALLLPDSDQIIEVTEATGPAYIEGAYVDGKFRRAQPYPSWVYDTDLADWVPPIDYPDDETVPYVWDEEAGAWVPYDGEAS